MLGITVRSLDIEEGDEKEVCLRGVKKSSRYRVLSHDENRLWWWWSKSKGLGTCRATRVPHVNAVWALKVLSHAARKPPRKTTINSVSKAAS